MLLSKLSIAVVFALVLSAISLAPATIYWVDGQDGDDSNPGTEEEPFASIQTGINHAVSDGDIVKVEDFTYTGENNRNLHWSGRGLTVESADFPPSGPPPYLPVIDCGGWDKGFDFDDPGPNTGVLIQGFVIKNSYRGAINCNYTSATINYCGIESTKGNGIDVRGSIAIDQCWFDACGSSNYPGRGVDVLGSAYITDSSFTNNYLAGIKITTREGDGIEITECTVSENRSGIDLHVVPNSNVLINKCFIIDNNYDGLSYWGYSGTIRNTYIAGNSSHGISVGTGNETACLEIFNCTVTDNGYPFHGGILSTGSDLYIVNSIVWGNHGTGDGNDITIGDSESSSSTATIEYSDTGSCLALGDSEFTWGAGNISTDPLLVGHWLIMDSPCIDTGLPVDPGMYYSGTDIDGDPRILGPFVDMGADEYTGCFPITYSTYNDWVTMDRPGCWCAPPHGSGYQCDGDADGETSGFWKYRVYNPDLNILVNNWTKTIDDPTLDPCADIDHKPYGFWKYRVYNPDFNILVNNWMKTDEDLPGDCPRLE